MYKQCKTEQSAARQRLLEQGLLELMEQSPYEDITVSDICAYLNIPRKTFYRYFPTKEDALYSLIDHKFLDMANFPVADIWEGKQRFQREMCRVFGYCEQEKRFLKIIEENKLTALLIYRITPIALTEMNIFRCSLSGLAPHKQEYVVGFFTGGIITMLLRWQNSGYAESVEQMALTAATLLGDPVLSNLIHIL